MALYVVVGSSSTVMYSTDLGSTWTKATDTEVINTPMDAVHVYDANTWYVGGGLNRKIYKTIDGGVTWAQYTLPVVTGGSGAPRIRRIKFFDANNGVCAIDDNIQGAFYTTADGGATWSKKTIQEKINDVYFFDQYTWILCNGDGDIKKTFTGGNTDWTLITNLGTELGRIHSNGQEVFCKTTRGGVFRSLDKGNVWGALVSTPGQAGILNYGSIYVNDKPLTGTDKYVYTTSQIKLASCKTTGGASWVDETAKIPENSFGFYDMFFASASKGVIVGREETVLVTTDGIIGAGTLTKISALPLPGNIILSAAHGLPNTCTVDITGVVTTDEIGATKGTATVSATSGDVIEYRLINAAIGYDSGWQLSNVFGGLSAGSYTSQAREQSSIECIAELAAVINLVNDLAGNLVVTNLTAAGANDGSIIVNVTTGSGSYSFLWSDGETTQNRLNLPVGVYVVTITDIGTGQTIDLTGTVNAPITEIIRDNYFHVPQVNSFRYVQQSTHTCEVPETPDNQLFCGQGEAYYAKVDYLQLVAQCDIITTQFRSNLPNHAVTLLKRSNDTLIGSYTPVKKVANLDANQTIGVRLQNHGAGQTRVYYNAGGSFPLEVQAGDSFVISGNADGFDGTYGIVSIETDVLTASEYLVINRNYDIAEGSTLGSGTFVVDITNYDVYEFTIDFSGIAIDDYYVKIRAYDDDGNEFISISEPIRVDAAHEGTHVIKFTNIDSAFNVDYTTAIEHTIRVKSHMFKRLPGSQKEVLRNTDGTLKKLSSKPRRIFTLELYLLPPYLHELLMLAFDHDTVKINGVEYVTEGGYGEPQYITRYPLANSQVSIEQAQWFDTWNSTDSGGVDADQGFIIANEGFIKR